MKYMTQICGKISWHATPDTVFETMLRAWTDFIGLVEF